MILELSFWVLFNYKGKLCQNFVGLTLVHFLTGNFLTQSKLELWNQKLHFSMLLLYFHAYLISSLQFQYSLYLVKFCDLSPILFLYNFKQIPDVFPLLAAAHKTLVAKSRESLTTRTLHSELVYNYSGSKHVKTSTT